MSKIRWTGQVTRFPDIGWARTVRDWIHRDVKKTPDDHQRVNPLANDMALFVTLEQVSDQRDDKAIEVNCGSNTCRGA